MARLESYKPASFDEATAQQMRKELFDLWVNEEVNNWIQAIRPETQELDLPGTSGHNGGPSQPNTGPEDPERRAQ